MARSWREGRMQDAGAEGNKARSCGMLGKQRRMKDGSEPKKKKKANGAGFT